LRGQEFYLATFLANHNALSLGRRPGPLFRGPWFRSVFSSLLPHFCVSFALKWRALHTLSPHLSLAIVSIFLYLIVSPLPPPKPLKASSLPLLFANHPHRLSNALGPTGSRSGPFGLKYTKMTSLNGGLQLNMG
jgi:hypothetical protein